MGVFEQYGLSVYRTVRGRGAYICETNQGIKLLRESTYREEKYYKEDFITRQLKEQGFNWVDTFERTENGTILSEDEDKKRYYLKNWFDCVECDVKSFHDVLSSCSAIARVHVALNRISWIPKPEPDFYVPVMMNLEEKYSKKVKEMISAGNYLRKKKKKSDFERTAFENLKAFLQEADAAMDFLQTSGYQEIYDNAVKNHEISHGSCNHHNILTGRGYVAVVNFERANINVQITDLYDFMRKILEKYNWDIKLAYRMMDEYNRIKTIGESELKILGILFSFPEKYFKIMDHYFNSSKAWIPDKDVEKLKNVLQQNEARVRFVESLK